MNERLFEEHTDLTVKKIIERVFEILGKEKKSLSENDDMNKIFMLSTLFLEDEKTQEKFKEITIYIDEVLMSGKKKSLMVIALANMISSHEKTNAILKLDINSLYLLVDFFRTRTMKQIKEEYQILNSEEFLYKIRRSSLDVDTRIDLLTHFVENAYKKGVPFDNEKRVKRLQDDFVEELRNNSANEILGRDNYMRGEYFRGIDVH